MKELIKIQSELKAPKGQFNNFGKYKYRNCEDILEAVKPLLNKYNCLLTISDTTIEVGGVLIINALATITNSEGAIEQVSAQAGIDINRKGMDIAQCFGSSSSYCRKYALNGLFLIDDTKDPDNHQPPTEKPKVKTISKEDVELLAQWNGELEKCNTFEEVSNLYNKNKPTDPNILILFTKRKAEINAKG